MFLWSRTHLWSGTDGERIRGAEIIYTWQGRSLEIESLHNFTNRLLLNSWRVGRKDILKPIPSSILMAVENLSTISRIDAVQMPPHHNVLYVSILLGGTMGILSQRGIADDKLRDQHRNKFTESLLKMIYPEASSEEKQSLSIQPTH